MPPFARVIWIVLDSVGIGEMPDAAEYGDAGSDTLGNIARQRRCGCRISRGSVWATSSRWPAFLRRRTPSAAYGRCALASPGKDTTTGHWEMVGIHLDKPLPLYPHGFPPEIMDEFERRIGRSTLGNRAASGTEIIAELGEEHMRTGSPIVYTSADSVFQVAAHEEVIPLLELYRMCETARDILRGPNEVGRVIARPFLGEPGSFTRTRIGRITPCRRPRACCSTGSNETGVFVLTAWAKSSTFSSAAAFANTRRRKATLTAWRKPGPR